MLKLSRRSTILPFTLAGAVGLIAACSGTKTEEDVAPAEDAGVIAVNDTGVVPPAEDSAVVVDSDSGTPDTGTPPTLCTKGSECPSNVCDVQTGKCLDASCKDGTRNQDETDIDCGGALCGKCDIQKVCALAEDCASGVCILQAGVRKCQQPACDDGVKNGDETGLDCGGKCGKCDDGTACSIAGDCKSDVCTAAKCVTPSCNDGAKNGTDTDIDCGGTACPRCADSKECLVASDCQSGVCTGGTCQVPKDSDNVKNGTETDKDCGGVGNKACDVGKKCAVGSDCKSEGCNYAGVCVTKKSCATHYGGDTCGLGGPGGVGSAQWEDCCTTAPVTVGGKTVQLGKYAVTSGRIRVFLEAINYNVRAEIKAKRTAGKIPAATDFAYVYPAPLPAGAPALSAAEKASLKAAWDASWSGKTVLEQDWDLFAPSSFQGSTAAGEVSGCAQKDWNAATKSCKPGTAYNGIYSAIKSHLGGLIFEQNNQSATGCYPGAPGTHAFRYPDGVKDGFGPPEVAPEQGQDVYDTKQMNCITYPIAQAFCIWDGGRLETLAEWQAAWGAGALPWTATSTAVPRGQAATWAASYWGCRFPWATDSNQALCGTKWNAPSSIDIADYQYSYEYPQVVAGDYISFLAIPGRTLGRGPAGHSDLVGGNFEMTSTFASGYGADLFQPGPTLASDWSTRPVPSNLPMPPTGRWSGNGSWEVHGYGKGGWGGGALMMDKYGKMGLRCAYP